MPSTLIRPLAPLAFARMGQPGLRLVGAAVLAHHAREAGLAHALPPLPRAPANPPAAPHADDLRRVVVALLPQVTCVGNHKVRLDASAPPRCTAANAAASKNCQDLFTRNCRSPRQRGPVLPAPPQSLFGRGPMTKTSVEPLAMSSWLMKGARRGRPLSVADWT